MSPAVTLVVAGALVPWSLPPVMIGGHVLAPLATLRRIATVSAVSHDGGTILIGRGGHACTLRFDDVRAACDGRPLRLGAPAFSRADGSTFVPLADVVRALGGDVTFDRATKTLAVAFATNGPVATPSPYAATPLPAVSPPVVFTPEPVVTPRTVATGSPRPRRTAIPAVPSQPL